MLHEITLGDKTIAAVGLENGIVPICIDSLRAVTKWDLLLCHKPHNDGSIIKHWIDLPQGNYKLIGIYPDMSEDSKELLLSGYEVQNREGVDYYNFFSGAYDCKSREESFESLMQREKLYTVNPYDDGRGNDYTDFNYFDRKKGIFNNEGLLTVKQWIDKHQEAEARTFKKFAILLKI